jgi:release factor glutamine methyltransferase
VVRRLISFIWFNLHKHKLKKTVAEKINGREFFVYPTVFNPKSYFSGKLFAGFVAGMDLKGKSVLDMGCGSGIIAVFAALGGAEVTAADLNPEAVKCTEANAKRNGVQVKAIHADLFSPLEGGSGGDNAIHPPIPLLPQERDLRFAAKRGVSNTVSPSPLGEGVRGVRFDLIFFNPPYYPKEPKNNFELAFNAGEDYRVLREFASQCKSHLKENGAVYMIVSSDIDSGWSLSRTAMRDPNDRKVGNVGVEAVKNTFNQQGFQTNIVLIKRKFFETFYVIKLVPAGFFAGN